MSINIGIVDQQVLRLVQQYGDRLEGDEHKKKSQAFVVLVTKTLLDLGDDEALDCLQDKGNDAGVDAIYVGEIQNSEFLVTIVQGKYKQRQDGESAFPANDVLRVANTVAALFDPYAELQLHQELLLVIEEIRSLVKEGNIPKVRVILSNNGKRWNEEGDAHIKRANLGEQVSFEHVNHDLIVQLLQRPRTVSDQIQFTGESIVEEFNFRRVLIGRVNVQELKRLFDRHGDVLLERNIRRYLGLHGNRVNMDIRRTLENNSERGNFYFYNNGITITCSQMRRNALQGKDHLVKIDDLQIINGGQTCKTIQRVIEELETDFLHNSERDFSEAFVLVRLYEIDSQNDDLVKQITYATNSQNPVDLRDLRSNDTIQRALETSVEQLGYSYVRKRDGASLGSKAIPVSVAAEAIFSVWRHKPHMAKFRSRELFGNYYREVFTDSLNGAQLVLSVLLYRYADAMRKRGEIQSKFRFAGYGHNFIAMEMGRLLLHTAKLEQSSVDHRSFQTLLDLFEKNRDHFFYEACYRIAAGIKVLGLSIRDASLQRLSATFRRADLLDVLNQNDLTKLIAEAKQELSGFTERG